MVTRFKFLEGINSRWFTWRGPFILTSIIQLAIVGCVLKGGVLKVFENDPKLLLIAYLAGLSLPIVVVILVFILQRMSPLVQKSDKEVELDVGSQDIEDFVVAIGRTNREEEGYKWLLQAKRAMKRLESNELSQKEKTDALAELSLAVESLEKGWSSLCKKQKGIQNGRLSQ